MSTHRVLSKVLYVKGRGNQNALGLCCTYVTVAKYSASSRSSIE